MADFAATAPSARTSWAADAIRYDPQSPVTLQGRTAATEVRLKSAAAPACPRANDRLLRFGANSSADTELVM